MKAPQGIAPNLLQGILTVRFPQHLSQVVTQAGAVMRNQFLEAGRVGGLAT
jgi:hypothetical protein